MKLRHGLVTLAAALPLVCFGGRAGADQSTPKATISFGNLRTAGLEAARGQALSWLTSAGKADAAALKAFDAIWKQADRPVLEKVADTFALGDAGAARLLDEARNPIKPAPTSVPAILKDKKRPAFFRSNLALEYGRALSNRRIFEESLEAFKNVKPEAVVDPAAYFFHRAVAEHALLLKKEANLSIIGLMEDVVDAPDRYKMVALLMYQDMMGWRDKDLGEITRKMDNIERRLELARGGPKTQKIQREVVARLDEIIKKLEKQGDCQCNGGACPNGGLPGGGANPSSPMKDSNIATNGGPGNVDPKRLKNIMQGWGKLPEKERAQAMQDLIRGMPERHRELIENYFKKLAQSQPGQP